MGAVPADVFSKARTNVDGSTTYYDAARLRHRQGIVAEALMAAVCAPRRRAQHHW